MKIRIVCTLIAGLVVVGFGSSFTVKADPQQDQQACMQDAQVICGQFIPDRERVAHCLIAHKSHVSKACRAALRHFKP